MNLDQYTPDAICRSMGLPGLIEPGWSPPTLRVLLKPSFHPEVCITIGGSGAALSVVALAESFWRQSVPCELPTFREKALIADAAARQLYLKFAAAFVADQDPEGRMVTLDGMSQTSCFLDDVETRQFSCHPYRPAVSAFVSAVIETAWNACSNPGVRNALADCGKYVGLNLPREAEEVPPRLFRIAVLGTPDHRAEFLDDLRHRTDANLTDRSA